MIDRPPVAGAEAWKTVHLRFTVFSVTPSVFNDAPGLFQEFFGFPHSAQTERPGEFLKELSSEKPRLNFQAVFVGPKADFILNAVVNTDSFDCLSTLPSGESFEDYYRRAAAGICEKIPGLVRVAVGQQFILPAISKEDAYQKLSAFLPGLTIDPKNSRELLYRINRPRTVNMDSADISFNRLCQWSCVQFQINYDPFGESFRGDSTNSVSLLTDVSTPGKSYGDLNASGKSKAVQELFELSKQSSLFGDVP